MAFDNLNNILLLFYRKSGGNDNHCFIHIYLNNNQTLTSRVLSGDNLRIHIYVYSEGESNIQNFRHFF